MNCLSMNCRLRNCRSINCRFDKLTRHGFEDVILPASLGVMKSDFELKMFRLLPHTTYASKISIGMLVEYQ